MLSITMTLITYQFAAPQFLRNRLKFSFNFNHDILNEFQNMNFVEYGMQNLMVQINSH